MNLANEKPGKFGTLPPAHRQTHSSVYGVASQQKSPSLPSTRELTLHSLAGERTAIQMVCWLFCQSVSCMGGGEILTKHKLHTFSFQLGYYEI